MASKTEMRKNQKTPEKLYKKVLLKKGDNVMVIAGGSGEKRPNKGKIGKILRFAGKKGDRVIVEGVNLLTMHLKQRTPEDKAGKVKREGSIHISNVMYYVESIKKPVRLKTIFMENAEGKKRKVRGYLSPTTKEFVQI